MELIENEFYPRVDLKIPGIYNFSLRSDIAEVQELEYRHARLTDAE